MEFEMEQIFKYMYTQEKSSQTFLNLNIFELTQPFNVLEVSNFDSECMLQIILLL